MAVTIRETTPRIVGELEVDGEGGVRIRLTEDASQTGYALLSVSKVDSGMITGRIELADVQNLGRTMVRWASKVVEAQKDQLPTPPATAPSPARI